MKVYHLAALFGGAVSAVRPLIGRDDGTTTAVVYVTSTYTITKCAASVTSCPAASATELFTSTTVMSVTTTICPVTSTPGGLPPANTDTMPDSVPTSPLPVYPGKYSVYVPPAPSSRPSIDFSVSLVSPHPSVPVTGTAYNPTTPSSLPVQTSALPTGSFGSDRPGPSASVSLPGSLTDSIPTSFPGSTTTSTVGYVPSQPLSSVSPSSSLPGPGTSADAVPTSGVATSGVYDQPSAPSNSATDTIPSSGYPSSSSGVNSPSKSSDTDTMPTSAHPGSSGLTASTGTDAIPTSGYPGSSALGNLTASSLSYSATDAVPASRYPAFSGDGSASSTGPVGTNTDAIPASSPTVMSSTLITWYPSGSIPGALSSMPSTASGTYPTVTSASSDLAYPAPTPTTPASTTVIDGTIRITSRLTLISRSYNTAPLPPSSNPATDIATDAVPTSRGTGYLPSGSGYPYPPNSANGTIVAPTPSYIEVPVNMGQVVAAGQSPIAAIVIALAFALFA
ncbi:hypothetical protein E8E12_008187 [Didymella heteroderae]|uniref:Uncharacterized protein n=1 Tax=Didymella heteroderae TaxID=1769908 RepID=A0A9P5C509_9PLEO|nr:hypothetical protein E8E12_008187 [Didymella heteroderae]